MPKISLTDFVDVVSASGVPKATKIAQIKSRPDYEPQFDFYKPLREAIQAMHKSGAPKKTLDNLTLALSDNKKVSNYPSAISGYKKWLGKKKITWFDPPRTELSQGTMDLIVNPELGLDIDGTRHLVKLYFKSEKLTKLRMDLITSVMEDCLRPLSQPGDVVTLVDVRRGKAFAGVGPSPKLSAIVGAELAYIEHLWPTL